MSGTTDSVRIIDMPDLGPVDDLSSVVGERAGSGRFSAPALRTYCLSAILSGDMTSDSFSSTSGYFYAGTGPTSLSYLGYDAPSSTWILAQGGHQNLTVGTDGTLTSRGTINCNGRLNAYGATTASMSLYNTTNAAGAGLWVTEGGHLWFGQTGSIGQELAGWGYLANNSITIEASSIFVNCANGPVCEGDQNNFYVPNAAWKPGGGSWSATSDARIKDVLGDYTSGLEAVMRLRPVRYTYRDNWHFGTTGTADPKLTGQEFIGLVAQQVEHVMPEMVSRTVGVIDGKEVDDLRTIDSTPLIYALLIAVQELAGRLAALEAREA